MKLHRSFFLTILFMTLLIQKTAQSEVMPGIYWSTFVVGKIQRANSHGSGIHTLKTSDGYYNFPDFAIDESSDRIFYTGFGYNVPSQLNRMNLDGTDNQLLYTTSDAAIRSISLDLKNGKIYWTEEFNLIMEGRVARSDLDGNGVEYILSTSDSNHIMPYGLAIDPCSDKLYLTDGRYGKVYRCNNDGSELEVLVSGYANELSGIVLDTDKGKMYWGEQFGNIMSADIDGNNAGILLEPTSEVMDIAIDFASHKIYWTDLDSHIYRANLNGTGIRQFINTGHVYPDGITVVNRPRTHHGNTSHPLRLVSAKENKYPKKTSP
jgi:hypothetical protein